MKKEEEYSLTPEGVIAKILYEYNLDSESIKKIINRIKRSLVLKWKK